MAKRTIEIYDCDVCHEPGFHYTLTTPDGLLSLDRCSNHDEEILHLRNLTGAKMHRTKRKTSAETSLEEIYKKMKK